jgi:NADPH:quinone reductase-like Zn-dependent oxidoreductase
MVAVPTRCLVSIPEALSDPLAAGFLLTGTTVWRMLFSRGNLTAGETVLIVGAGGGVNSLATFVAKRHGATVIALAGSSEKQRAIRAIGADETILYRDNPQWHREVLRLTGGRGVDLVVDNVGAVTMERSLKAVRRGGRIVTVGSTSGPMLTIDNRMIFSKQLSLIGSTMGSTPDFQHAIEFLWSPAIQPHLPLLIDAIAPFEHGIEMMARLEAGEQSGKIVLMMK